MLTDDRMNWSTRKNVTGSKPSKYIVDAMKPAGVLLCGAKQRNFRFLDEELSCSCWSNAVQ